MGLFKSKPHIALSSTSDGNTGKRTTKVHGKTTRDEGGKGSKGSKGSKK